VVILTAASEALAIMLLMIVRTAVSTCSFIILALGGGS
jgi:hypothetical protein